MVQKALGSAGEAVTGAAKEAESAVKTADVALQGNTSGACPSDTGGTCRIASCNADRNAACVDGLCVCSEGECAVDGKCIRTTTTSVASSTAASTSDEDPAAGQRQKQGNQAQMALGTVVSALTGKSEEYEKEAKKAEEEAKSDGLAQEWSLDDAQKQKVALQEGDSSSSSGRVFVTVAGVSTLMVGAGVAFVRSGLCRDGDVDEEVGFAASAE